MSIQEPKPERTDFDCDVAIIGSGFGGSVSALRLAEKGYSVVVFEAGRRFTEDTYAKNSWDLKNFLWAPELGFFGIQRIHVLKGVAILAGSGVGGGSLVYANTLYVPGDTFFQDPQWGEITDASDEAKCPTDRDNVVTGCWPLEKTFGAKKKFEGAGIPPEMYPRLKVRRCGLTPSSG